MRPCNIPIIVLSGTSSPADIKRAIDRSNQTVVKSDGRKNRCKSKKTFADFNLASLPYKVLFIFGVIVVLLQNNTTSSSLEVNKNGRSLGEYYEEDLYEYDRRGGRGSRWQKEEDMHKPRMRGSNEDYYDERKTGYPSSPGDKHTFHHIPAIPLYDDEEHDKGNVIPDIQPTPKKPDDDHTDKDEHSKIDPEPEVPSKPDDNPPSTTLTAASPDGENKPNNTNEIVINKTQEPKEDDDKSHEIVIHQNQNDKHDDDENPEIVIPNPHKEKPDDDKSHEIVIPNPHKEKPDDDRSHERESSSTHKGKQEDDKSHENVIPETDEDRHGSRTPHTDHKGRIIANPEAPLGRGDDHHHDAPHRPQHAQGNALRGTMHQCSNGPNRRHDKGQDEREFRTPDQHRRAVDNRRGGGGYDDYNGPDGYRGHYGRRFGDHHREAYYASSEISYDDEFPRTGGRGSDGRSIHYEKTQERIDEDIPSPHNGQLRGSDDRSIHFAKTQRMIDEDIPYPPNGRFRRSDDRSINYAEIEKMIDEDIPYPPNGRFRRSDDRSIHYEEIQKMINEDIPSPPNGRLRGEDDRSNHYERYNSTNYEEDFNRVPRAGRMESANPFNAPKGAKDDDHTIQGFSHQGFIDDVNDARNFPNSKCPSPGPHRDPREICPSRTLPAKPDDQFFDEDRFDPHDGPGKFPDGRKKFMAGGPQGNQGGRGPQARGARPDMEEDMYSSFREFMRKSPDNRGEDGGRKLHGLPDRDNEEPRLRCTRSELQDQMAEQELNCKIRNLRPETPVKEMFVLFNQVLSLERKKFVRMQEYIMQYSQYLQKTLMLPTSIRMKYWWRAHYNMTDELIKKERGDFQDFYALVTGGQCERGDFLSFVNAKRKSWAELRDLMTSIWMEILTYKMKKHSKL
ncbi:hypothetical protein C922_05042 [Plasmodium inui San Antonio 1]|uniref:Plasmodium RESA N-terminal domain-containing protein n=1 Tax=Plasmodium inui San Antonio 1 TaxID=1237626 RepID=W7AH33_9APIC|nr:hypothetical protein C922_05042 [Plasmodium inui San Antonio 1]EUD64571.1 hypothetical protein C922_05042 [Plasmodium inui San Antonio 1]